jgi:hypothetical protein
MRITCGTIRPLTKSESKQYKDQGYCWVVVDPYTYENGDIKITVPIGFLTDGSSGGPDYGCSWLFHDWLYATHCYECSDNTTSAVMTQCSRSDADNVMSLILDSERLSIYLRIFNLISYFNFFWCFSRAWHNSGLRGPQFLESELMEIKADHKDINV